MMVNARSVIILCLTDKILKEVVRENTMLEIWIKLEYLYMIKSLAHRLCRKQKFYSFQMLMNKSIGNESLPSQDFHGKTKI